MLGKSLKTTPLLVIGSVLERQAIAKHVLGMGGRNFTIAIPGTFIFSFLNWLQFVAGYSYIF